MFALTIVLVVLTAYSIDVYLTNKGEVGLFARVAQFIGLDQGDENSKIAQTTLSLTFDFQVRENFVHLKEEFEHIDAQRDEIIGNRNETFKALIDQNNALKKMIQDNLSEIARLRKPYLLNDRVIVQVAEDLIDTHRLNDSELRKSRYRNLEGRLIELINQKVEVTQEDTTRLKNVLYGIEQIVVQSGDYISDDCDEYNECIEKRKQYLYDELTRIFEPVLKKSGRSLEKFNELLGMWEGEYYYQLDYMGEYKKQDNLNNLRIIGAIQQLINQVIEISANDLKDIIYVYKIFGIEYSQRIKDLQDSQDRRKVNVDFIYDQLQMVALNLSGSSERDFKELLEKFEEFKEEYKKLQEELTVNDDQIRQVSKHKLFEARQFISKICSLMKIDVEMLINDSAYAEGINATYLQLREHMKQVQY